MIILIYRIRYIEHIYLIYMAYPITIKIMKKRLFNTSVSVIFWVCTFITVLSLPDSVQAGAWCQPPGGLYLKLSDNHYFTVDTFDKHGDKHRNDAGSNFHDHNITFYGEYGLMEDLTISSTLAYKELRSHTRNVSDGEEKRRNYNYHGLGDMEIALKYGLIRKPVVMSVQGLVKTAWFYDSGEDVPPGNNQNDYELKLLFGRSLWPFPGYCGLELGYRWRTGNPSDEYRYLVEFGMNLTKRLSFRVKLDGIKSAKNASLPESPEPYTSAYIDYETGRVIKTVYPTSSGGMFANPSLGMEYDLGKLELTLGFQLVKNWSVECTYTGYPYGENIASGDQYSFALVYYFSGKKSG